MVLFSLVLALLITYVDELFRSFHSFNADNQIIPSGLAMLFYMLPIIIMVFYCVFLKQEKLSSLNLPHLINVFMFVPIHFFILMMGIEFVLYQLALTLIIFTLVFWGGLSIKRPLLKFNTKILLFAMISLGIFILGRLLEYTLLVFVAYLVFSFTGVLYTLCEAQFLKLRLLNVKNKQSFYRIVNSSILNFSCNFYLMFVLFDIGRYVIKSCAFQAYATEEFKKSL